MHIFTLQPMDVAARFGVKLCLEAEFWLMLVAPGVGLGVGPQWLEGKDFLRCSCNQKKRS